MEKEEELEEQEGQQKEEEQEDRNHVCFKLEYVLYTFSSNFFPVQSNALKV